ncbi:DUF4389 domain-containing protein [Nocardioides campestrisoli]|uniref:DUF4389 domain-containing protein n=1 Tax=Nocardioides campestrisoli TaxID=2736757 RepID=UPI00163DCAF1|nr:DUF4389 domain-containing protein [Nocardioides campestrisoli]
MSTVAESTPYPVRVEATLDPNLSRGLWLVKWLLLVPHLVVLAFLWCAAAVCTVLAFFSILITAHYPRVLFDFNVGVMRWTWRVSFYSYNALGTDRYPPFSLQDVPDYPAHLSVDYPPRLSRGLVLVKWWLLAIPHYLVLGLLLGGGGYAVSGSDGVGLAGSLGLIGLLVLFAGVALLCTRRYPPRLFDLVLGLDRWWLRVSAYTALMTDRYPPFQLDQGGQEPLAETTRDAALPEGPGHGRSVWSGGRVTTLVVGSVLVFSALGLLVVGLLGAVLDQEERDADGFFMTPSLALSTDSYAIASERLDLHTESATDVVPDQLLGDVRLRADPRSSEQVFIGIGPTSAVRDYLSGVGHVVLVDLRDGDPVYRTSPRETPGSAPAEAPGLQDFWAASASGGQDTTLTWTPEDGEWTAVVMNADAAPGVAARVSVGTKLPALQVVLGTLLLLAGALFVVGALLVLLAILSAARADRAARSRS